MDIIYCYDQFEKKEYMIVGCKVINQYLHMIEIHIFAVPLNMFKKEQLLAQWIWDNNYDTKSTKVRIPTSVKSYNNEYIELPENVPLKIEEHPNQDSSRENVEWCFSLNNIDIGFVTSENFMQMKYTFNEGFTSILFNAYRELQSKMDKETKEFLRQNGYEDIEIEGLESGNIIM